MFHQLFTNVKSLFMYGNFKFEELITTSSGLPNYPLAPDDLVNLAELWRYLASVREELGQPIIINSAFRTPQVNEQVGGVKCSYHIKGRAADIRTSPLYMDVLYKILKRDRQTVLSEFIVYSTFYHIAL